MLTTAQLSPMSAAKSPEEAAQIFKGLITQALAEVIAKQLDSALNTAKGADLSASAVQGWTDFVGGAALQMTWDRSVGLPTGQITCFAPRDAGSFAAYGVGVSIGISISGSF